MWGIKRLFNLCVNYPKDGDESLWAQMEVIGGGFAIPIIKWLGIAVNLFIQWLAWVSILMSGRLSEPVYAATDLRWVSLLPDYKVSGAPNDPLKYNYKKTKTKTNKQTNEKQPILGSEMWTIKLQKIVGNLLNKLRKF